MLSQSELKELLEYNPATGEFKWRAIIGHRRTKDGLAGYIDRQGYRMIWIGKRSLLAHRLAWLYVYGEWPTSQIDHANRDRSDNRIENLRLATAGQNGANRIASNKSGVKGVHRVGAKWQAVIKKDQRLKSLGVFETIEEAKRAYDEAASRLFGEFSRSD